MVGGADDLTSARQCDADAFLHPVVEDPLYRTPSPSRYNLVPDPYLFDWDIATEGGYLRTLCQASVRSLPCRHHQSGCWDGGTEPVLLGHRLTVGSIQDVLVHLVNLIKEELGRVRTTDCSLRCRERTNTRMIG